MKITTKIMLAIAAVALLMGGCTTAKKSNSGFLSDYSNLKSGPKDGVELVYKKPGVNFGKYNKVIVDKISFYIAEDSDAAGLRADELKEMSDLFEKELVAAINDSYPMVAKPGADTLRVRIAITDLESSNPGLGAIGAVLPIGIAANLISNLSTGESLNVGSASIEAEFVDSVNNEVVASVVDRKVGSTYDTASVKGKWGHSKKAFQQWAEMLRKWLDEVHGK